MPLLFIAAAVADVERVADTPYSVLLQFLRSSFDLWAVSSRSRWETTKDNQLSSNACHSTVFQEGWTPRARNVCTVVIFFNPRVDGFSNDPCSEKRIRSLSERGVCAYMVEGNCFCSVAVFRGRVHPRAQNPSLVPIDFSTLLQFATVCSRLPLQGGRGHFPCSVYFSTTIL